MGDSWASSGHRRREFSFADYASAAIIGAADRVLSTMARTGLFRRPRRKH
jgi:hypothetical protein